MARNAKPTDPLFYLTKKGFFGLAKSFLIEPKLKEAYNEIIENDRSLKEFSENLVYGTDVERMKSVIQRTSDEDLMRVCLSKKDVGINALYEMTSSIPGSEENTGEFPRTMTVLQQALEHNLSEASVLMLVEDPRFDQSHHYVANFNELISYLQRKNNLCADFFGKYFAVFDKSFLNEDGQNFLMVLARHLLHNPTEENTDSLANLFKFCSGKLNFDVTQKDVCGMSIFDYCIEAMFPVFNPEQEDSVSHMLLEAPLSKHRRNILLEVLKHPNYDINVEYCSGNMENRTAIFEFLRRAVQYLVAKKESSADERELFQVLQDILADERLDASLKDANGDNLLFYFVKLFLNLVPAKVTDALWQNRIKIFVKMSMFLMLVPKMHRQDGEGKTVLMLSMENTIVMEELCFTLGTEKRLELLDINLPDFEGKTALMQSVRNGRLKAVHLCLSQQSLDLDLSDDNEKTALMYALELPKYDNKQDILRVLGTDKRLMNSAGQDRKCGSTIYHTFVRNKDFSSLKVLLKNRHNPNAAKVPLRVSDKNSRDILDVLIAHMATKEEIDDCNEMIELILRLPGVNVNDTYAQERTLLHKAAIHGCSPLISLLFKTNNPRLNINAQDEKGYTPLMYAVLKPLDLATITQFLICDECDLDLQTKDGKTLSDIVCSESADGNIHCLLQVASSKQKVKEVKECERKSISEQMKTLRESIKHCDTVRKELKDDFITEIDGMLQDLTYSDNARFNAEGSMEQMHRLKLKCLRPYLCEELMPQSVFAHLIADDIIDDDLAEEIGNEKSRRKMCEKFLSVLPLRGPNAYASFLKALEKEGQKHIADKLESFDPHSSRKDKVSDDAMQMVPFKQTKTRVSQSQDYMGIKEPFAIVPLRFIQPTTRLSESDDEE